MSFHYMSLLLGMHFLLQIIDCLYVQIFISLFQLDFCLMLCQKSQLLVQQSHIQLLPPQSVKLLQQRTWFENHQFSQT